MIYISYLKKFQRTKDIFESIKYNKDLYSKAIDAIENADIPHSDHITLTNNGYYDLEKKGLSGKGIWIGFQHGKGYTLKKMLSPMRQAANLLNKVLFDGEGTIDDRIDDTDMLRLYKAD